MGTYCTVAQVRQLIYPMTKGVSPVILDDPLIESHISRAESLINSYVGSRYNIPLSPVPLLATTIAADIAAYYSLVTLFSRDNQNKNKWVENFLHPHLNTEKKTGTLYDIQNGRIALYDGSGVEPSSSESVVASNNQDYHSNFDVDDPINWNEDKDRLDNIAREREN